jgi:hypothetical protein
MHPCWKILAAALCAVLTIAAATTANAAEIAFSSQRDFTEISLNIKDTYNVNPESIGLEVTLSQDAQQRMEAASSTALGQDLTLVIDGKAVSTSHVQSVLDTPQLQISMSRQLAIALLPGLLGLNPGSNLPAAPPVVQTQEVAAPSISASLPETPSAPVAATQEPAAPSAAADPMPEPDATPVAADPPPAAPFPAIPGWALGVWLPTSATSSPFAEIHEGDPVTIFAHALDAIACNKARLSVLESTDEQVRLQIDKMSDCVISNVQVDQVRISPSTTPGKVVISLYAQGDDMNGAPAKEGTYRRK